jgi:chromosome segregation ATPase
LKLEKMEFSRRVEELNEKINKNEQQYQEKEQAYIKQIDQMIENYQEGPQKKMLDEQHKKFKELAERMQTKYNKMNEEHKMKQTQLEGQIAQYKDILKGVKNTDDLEKELEDTKEKLTQQIMDLQEKHEAELEKVKLILNKKIEDKDNELEKEKENFKQKLAVISASSDNTEEAEVLKKQLEEEKKLSSVNQSKALSFGRMIEQMQLQLDQSKNDYDKLKKDLDKSKDKEKGLEQTIQMLNTQLSMLG